VSLATARRPCCPCGRIHPAGVPLVMIAVYVYTCRLHMKADGLETRVQLQKSPVVSLKRLGVKTK
jgi:hypothetical protein